MKRREFLALLGSLAASVPTPAWAQAADPLAALRRATGARFGEIWTDPRFELQVLYTRIDRRSGAAPLLTHFQHGLVPERWFAPASLIKLPVAALALERVRQLAQRGVTADTAFTLRGAPPCAQGAAAESESVARAIRRMFVVSENEPYNRLYELLGQDLIHARLGALGCPMSRIIARIAQCAPAANRSTGALDFIDADGRTLARIDAATAPVERRFPHGRALKGSAWVERGRMVPGARDFSTSNFMPLDEAHRLLIAVVLPEAVAPAQRFDLAPAAHEYLRHCMGMLPAECADPVYAARDYPPMHAKYLLGGAGQATLPAGVRSFNKVGRSFGTLADCAYISDAARGAEFFLSAALYVNADDVLNDGRYEYAEQGWPFLAALGRAALELDVARPRANPFVALGADGRFAH